MFETKPARFHGAITPAMEDLGADFNKELTENTNVLFVVLPNMSMFLRRKEQQYEHF
jgi:hypothetical protein